MKKLVITLAMLAALPAAAGQDSTHRWFHSGLAWYQHPCGLQVFAVYGQWVTPENRRNYHITKRQPELCSKLFPLRQDQGEAPGQGGGRH